MASRSLASFIACAAVAVFAAGCSTTTTAAAKDKPAAPKSDAELTLERGMEAMKDKNYEEARAYFDAVIGRYPYLEVARIAELRIADLAYDKEDFADARDRYQQFVKLHPTSAEVDYAAFRAALSNYKEIPGDFFILPPSYEKDQTPERNALRALEDFIRQYPKSKYIDDAKKAYSDTRARLARHEMYVADFYAKRDKWPAVVTRLSNVVDRYPGAGYDAQALFGIHDAYLKMRDQARAKDALKRIITMMPGTKDAEKAQKLLGTG